MKSQEKALRFFLGTNTPQGFVSRFDRLSDKNGGWRTLIIKGGPGSGKSTMMKKVAGELKDEKLELIHCSSDFNSLDAVICPARRFAVVDGTSPHANVTYFSFWPKKKSKQKKKHYFPTKARHKAVQSLL